MNIMQYCIKTGKLCNFLIMGQTLHYHECFSGFMEPGSLLTCSQSLCRYSTKDKKNKKWDLSFCSCPEIGWKEMRPGGKSLPLLLIKLNWLNLSTAKKGEKEKKKMKEHSLWNISCIEIKMRMSDWIISRNRWWIQHSFGRVLHSSPQKTAAFIFLFPRMWVLVKTPGPEFCSLLPPKCSLLK